MRTFQVLGLSLLGSILPVAFWLGIDLAGSKDIGPMTVAGLSISLLFLFVGGLTLELFFQLVRIPGALFLRIEQIWNFASPAICIFLLTAEPLIRWSGLVSSGPALPQLAGHSILLALALILLLGLLFIFPLFRGMNATFLLAGVLAARFLLIPANIGPDSGFQEYATFTLYSFALSLLVFLFLQSRRRLALSPGYETFPVPYGLSYFAFFLIPCMLALYFAATNWYSEFPVHIPALLSIFLAVHWWVSGIMLSRDAEGKGTPPISFLLIAALIGLFVLTGFSISNGTLSRTAYRSQLTSESLTFFAAFLDRDRDGNSSFPGGDPDDSNPDIRADFISNREVNIEANDIEGKENGRMPVGDASGERLLTLILDAGAFASNPRPSSSLSVLSSDEIPWALRNILHSRDAIAQTERRSILSDYVDGGYRTICTGNGEYFNHVHPSRLDEGCQILEPVNFDIKSADAFSGEEAANDLEEQREGKYELQGTMRFLSDSRKLFRKYREDQFFFWVHLDLRGATLSWADLEPLIQSWNQDFEGKRHTLVLLHGPAGLVFIDSDLFPRARRNRIGFYRSGVPAPWSQAMHELYGPGFKYPMQSFGMTDRLWVGNQMTGSKMEYPLPWKSDDSQEADGKRKLKNLQP